MALAFRLQKSPMPGFGLGMGITLAMLSLIVILPVGALLARGISYGPEAVWATINTPRVWAALYLSFRLAFLAALVNLVFGTLLAWVLARYDFPGRRLVDALVDLPFALPTAVAGIALTALYAPNGVFGSIVRDLGGKIAYTQWGILIALIFVGLPFVTRTVQPVIAEIEQEVEEASATLGAGRFHTLRRVILPLLLPAALTGFALSLARAVGEYGSVIFIAGNLPMKTEIAPLLIVIKLEEFDYDGAAAIGIAMLLISFAMLLAINLIQIWSRRRIGHV
ncbi:sulfate ABC transporter permease subunit CysT [Paracoccus sp. P2]|uniref:Sulfate transport system permease protein CysT n=1 Tax=Paracoccus pantotrophus TaxID=82367 RepID=A0A454NL68_PARPN|nr:sulfate ABC transporter permease subunit CysT [Paracoccus pantotrophus]QFG35747.1 sulfate ABC transporter permease subunit CysT [Paracoccus pantotrophus]QLH14019.1 sulfate ABC transporter permease subunit CysT [Paracoccus pantotrophus]RDD96857.1 sulfate ABC transporter permease subunit CysT [Paracoccus pantotrophus]RKS44008.1 sulfate transport system permease protein [Paracoccus pantotrophus]RNI17366.1 sulfate ABC transporter permease subunit CysT [Paracoccus pantotrophus]